MKAILTIGISASGKTTWALYQPGYAVVSRDNYRWTLMDQKGIEPSWTNWKWKWEDQVTALVDADLKLYAVGKQNVIIADTNLSPKTRDEMTKKLEALGYEVSTQVFDISYDEAVKRDNERKNGVGAPVIQKQYQQFLDQFGQRVTMNPNKQPAAIVDIDGTVAIMGNHRGPFEWDKVHLDDPNQPVIEMVRGLAAAGYYILFTSGRDSVCRERTIRWLHAHIPEMHEIHDWFLFMRPEGDLRKDTVIKEEIFRNQILEHFNVKVVLDDRPSVCRMWRDLGLNVVQIGNPYIEF